jgi:cyclopropane-fatty-acyl-phospholipid synthase
MSTAESVAASIDTPLAALPLAAELFAPLRSLGSQPRRVVAWLRAAGLRAGDRVLDLGCGKGAAAVAVADRLGCRVMGMDAFEPFIQAAAQYAVRRRVANLCEFRRERIEGWRGVRRRFDAVIILGVLPLSRASRTARRFTRRGGVYLIDDAVRVSRTTADPALKGVPSVEQALRVIEATGDRVERVHVASRTQSRRMEMALFDRLRIQAAKMARKNPRHRPLLKECLDRQVQAIALLTGPLRAALWLVRRK